MNSCLPLLVLLGDLTSVTLSWIRGEEGGWIYLFIFLIRGSYCADFPITLCCLWE